MKSVGCTYVLIHLYTYVTVTIKENKAMGLGGSERTIWNIYGRNWREEGKRVSGFTVFQFLKYKLRRSSVKMNFTMSPYLDTGEKRAIHPPCHMPAPQSWGSFELSHALSFPAGYMLMGLCVSSLDTEAPL